MTESLSPVPLSTHAARRMRSRGVGIAAVAAIVRHGERRLSGDGRTFVRVPKECSARIAELADAHDVTVVLSPEGRVVTVYRGKPRWNR